MRTTTITTTYEVYHFAELSESAKQTVRQWYLDGQDSEFFTEDCEMLLKEYFPKSELKVQYSLGYCQGDGLNIYGEMNLNDIYRYILDRKPELFTEKEKRYLEWVIQEYGTDVKLESNWRYCYCRADSYDFIYDITEDMEYNSIRGIKTEVLEKFNTAAQDCLSDLCGEFEESGYNYFYEIEDADLEDWCEANEYEFTEDGSVF